MKNNFAINSEDSVKAVSKYLFNEELEKDVLLARIQAEIDVCRLRMKIFFSSMRFLKGDSDATITEE